MTTAARKRQPDHPLYFILHDEPNPEMTSFVFRETLMTHLLLWGNAYAQIIRNGKGEVVALYPAHAEPHDGRPRRGWTPLLRVPDLTGGGAHNERKPCPAFSI
jgi:hypothetical protein